MPFYFLIFSDGLTALNIYSANTIITDPSHIELNPKQQYYRLLNHNKMAYIKPHRLNQGASQ
ncbi:hypothetical protein EGK75_00365 [Neisseria weixii]|uniref:Uncharacterized protein n=1 Tax=Neisseria weixii TaxID=1853276 RepID=A0A3N4N3Q2_9NEIS|nr:hypothetical protein EGK74_00360 [Neisseria weixii]RPD91036.1 hypothetical protein EGK75_00365 [Neisseria weixii]